MIKHANGVRDLVFGGMGSRPEKRPANESWLVRAIQRAFREDSEDRDMLRVNLKSFGNTAILSLRGRIVRGETKCLHEAVNSQTDVAAVVLDLAGVNTIDAGGLGLLLKLREQTPDRNHIAAYVPTT